MVRSFLAPAALALWLCGMQQIYAGPANPLATVDENGIGTLQFPGALPITMPGVLAPDPGPGGLAAALTYNLLGPPALVAGDLLILERNAGSVLSELIRFNPAGTGAPAYRASLVFYSDIVDGDLALADTGFPTALYANNVTITEVGPPTVYTPGPNDPGFIPGFQVSYSIDSDIDVPEPASLTLLGIGIAGLAAYEWRRRKKTSA